jgi:ABC-2 type transport system permease protein
MGVLLRKLLRDLRVPLLVVALLLGGFQCLWVKVTQSIVTEIAPFMAVLTRAKDLAPDFIQSVLFRGPGRMMQSMAGGDTMRFERAIDMLTIGYAHPLMQMLFCIWAIGRAAGAISGELDRGTMELLMAQPLARFRLVVSHLCVDLLTIPFLCLSLWAGTWLGSWITGPFTIDKEAIKEMAVQAKVPPQLMKIPDDEGLRYSPREFVPGLWAIGGLMFAVSGTTMWLSARGRFRWRVMGGAILFILIQYGINLLGQVWDTLGPLRPFSIFYYFDPQRVILRRVWTVDLAVWNHGQPLVLVPTLAVLLGVGCVGYLMALWTFSRRDLPTPV